jgi:hypothetical protein
VAAVAIAGACPSARADGAFPDAQAVLLPVDAPHRMVVGTNFGLLISDDDGATWGLACERDIGTLVSLYQLGPAPTDVLYAVGTDGLAVSRDGACSWQPAGGALAGTRVLDAFPDGSDGAHLLALAAASGDGGAERMGLYESRDAGASFGPPLWVAPTASLLTGVEIARTAPSTVYLTGIVGGVDPKSTRPFLVRSSDGGAHFDLVDETAALGPRVLRLAAVDPTDPATLYLRAEGQVDPADALAITHDGGDHVAIALQLATRMSGFLRRADGTLLVATRDGDLYRSTDGGAHFTSTQGPHFRGLGERDGALYAATDFLVDGFGLAVDKGDGAWHPVLVVPRIQGPLACGSLPADCTAAWHMVEAILGYAPAGAATTPDLGPRPSSDTIGGCGCAIGARGGRRSPAELAFVLALALGLCLGRPHCYRRRPPCV